MNDPLRKFKVLVVHAWPGLDDGPRRVEVSSVAAAAVYIVDMLCQGFRAGALGDEIHVFHPSALGTVPVHILETVALSGTTSGPPPAGLMTALDLVGRSHGPMRSHAVPTPTMAGLTGSNVVPIDAARMFRGTKGGRS